MVAELKGKLSLDGKPFIDTLKDVGDKVEKDFGKQLTDLGKKIAGAFAVKEIVDFTTRAISLGDEIDNLAQQTDLSAESVQALRVAADDAGVGFDTLRPTINQMRRAIDEARDGNDQFIDAFGRLGISIDDLRSMNTEQIFDAVAKSIADAGGNADVMTASTKVLGAESTRLLGIFKQVGEEGLQGLIDGYIEHNRILSNDTVAALDKAEIQVKEFTDNIRNAFITVIAKTIEFVNELRDTDSERMEGLKGELDALEREYNNLQQAHGQAFATMKRAQDELESSTNDLKTAQQNYINTLRSGFTDEDKQADLKTRVVDLQEQIVRNAEDEQRLRGEIALAEQNVLDIKNTLADKDKEIADAQDRLNKLVKDEDDLRNQSFRTRANIEQKEQNITDLQEDQVEAQGELQRLQNERQAAANLLVNAETDLVNLNDELVDTQADMLNNSTALINDQRELNGLVEDEEKARQDAADAAAEQLREDNERKKTLGDIIKELEDAYKLELKANGETEEALRLKRELERKQKDLNDLRGVEADKQEEAKTASIDQLEAVEKLRDMFKVMTEAELDMFVAKLKEIAKELASIDPVNLDWLKPLSDLAFNSLTSGQAGQMSDAIKELITEISKLPDVPEGKFDFLKDLSNLVFRSLTSSQASQMADAIKELITEINKLPDVPEGKFDFLEDLANLKFRSLTSSQASQMADAIEVLITEISRLPDVPEGKFDFLKDLANLKFRGFSSNQASRMASAIRELVSGISSVDTGKLSEVVGLLAVLDSLSLSGKSTIIDITMPDGFEGIPLVFSPEANTTLQSIDRNLNTLAGLKGVVWA